VGVDIVAGLSEVYTASIVKVDDILVGIYMFMTAPYRAVLEYSSSP
jgi:hypothetical protein